MSIEPTPALVVSVVSLVAQGVNAWLMLKRKSDAADLVERLDKRYVTRERFDAELRRVDERAGVRSVPVSANL
jgi:hypothetical protein